MRRDKARVCTNMGAAVSLSSRNDVVDLSISMTLRALQLRKRRPQNSKRRHFESRGAPRGPKRDGHIYIYNKRGLTMHRD